MAKTIFSRKTKLFLEERANFRCEYCLAPSGFSPHLFSIDHILPIILGGSDGADNLAYCCFFCNQAKSKKTKVMDPFTQKSVPLFHPRNQNWAEHFSWTSDFLEIVGLTSAGRATVDSLQLNRPELLRMRRNLVAVHLHPPD